MNETEFLRYSDQLFAHIEDQLDQCGADFDCEHNGNVLTIEADNGTQIIVNRHTPNQERRLPLRPARRRMALHTRRQRLFRHAERSVGRGGGRSGGNRAAVV